MSWLFIDTLSSPAFICLFDHEKNITDSISWEGKHLEFDTLTESIDALLSRNTVIYPNIAAIVCIVWPGGFTGIRVTTLVANSLGYSFQIPLYSVTVSDFFHWQNCPIPWLLPLTKTEVVFWENSTEPTPLIVKIATLQNLNNYTSNQVIPPLWGTIPHSQANNYQVFLDNFSFPEKVSLLHPLYARDPNVLMRK